MRCYVTQLLATSLVAYVCSHSLPQENGSPVKNRLLVILVIIIIVSSVTVFAGVLFVDQPGANHAPGASVTQVNHSVHTISAFLIIRADPSMHIF